MRKDREKDVKSAAKAARQESASFSYLLFVQIAENDKLRLCSQEADEYMRLVVHEAVLDARASFLVTQSLVFAMDSLTQVCAH